MNGYRRAKSWRSSVIAAVVGVTAVLGSILMPAQSAEAAVEHISVDGKPVTVTSTNSHNWGSLSPNNVDTVILKDGSRGSYWSFSMGSGECVKMTMRSDDFNPYISLRTGAPDGNALASQEGAYGRAQITLTSANGGTYYLLASSSGRGEKRGEYTLDFNRC